MNERVCICADPENCQEPIPGYICQAGRASDLNRRKSSEEKLAQADEREQFEKWARGHGYSQSDLAYTPEDGYTDNDVHSHWEGWQARADIAAERQRRLAEFVKWVRGICEEAQSGFALSPPDELLRGIHKVAMEVIAEYDEQSDE